MTTLPSPTVLSQGQRHSLAVDPDFGGGSVLQAALSANPCPDVPFIRLARPLVGTDGQPVHELSLSRLDHLAQSWSVWYLARGVRPRDRVAIFLDDSFAYAVHFFALSQIGAIPVLVNSRASRATALALCRQTTPVGLCTDAARLRELGDVRTSLGVHWVSVTEELPAPPPAQLSEADRFRHAPDDPVSILHSSGTTGRPKPVVQTHRSSTAGPRFRMLSHAETPGAVMMTALPQAHLGCIAYTTYAVLTGTPIVALHDPTGAELAAAVGTYRPSSVMAFAHAYGELAELDLPPGSLDSVNAWVTMGDAIHEAHLRKILQQRSPHLPPSQFLDRLGTTELGWGALLHVSTHGSPRKDRCVGRPTGVADVTVLRPDGTHADVGEVGFLGAQGPAVTAGYWNDADTTYRSMLAGYWLTGDVAYRDHDGSFYQVDRAVDAIRTPQGTGFSVLMEEVLLREVAEISDCAVVAGARDGTHVPVAVVRSATPGMHPARLLERANAALRASGQPELALLEVARSEADLPLGVTGKVLKRVLREKYADLSAYAAAAEDRVLAVHGGCCGTAGRAA
ncbi:class I adenylate-forming enzyme family protein [Geodermatophilus sp. CPCC 205506]|uniref:class I adenylate-forming enzyme family protein n=1 Tax=Geodermatophilus sp. CPCC 205506 TaxID=2936596 RepID=UPI003EEF387E